MVDKILTSEYYIRELHMRFTNPMRPQPKSHVDGWDG